MRQSLRPLALALAAALAFAGCVNQADPEESTPPTNSTPEPKDNTSAPPATNVTPPQSTNNTTKPPAAPRQNLTENVTIIDDTFSPGVLYVKAGTAVTWTNEDRSRHTVTDLGGDFDSGSLSRGDTFTHVFSERGEFFYLSQLDDDMQGRIIVE